MASGMQRSHTAGWSFMFWLFCIGPTMAEDPIIVHYSDPSLTRLEKQLGITAAQRDRFDDIIVKYRDPLNNTAANGNESDTRPADDQRQKHGRGGKSNAGGKSSAGIFGGRKRNIPRQELDELATILTPDQIKQFEELKKGKGGAKGSKP
jgi:hypothetical protein